MGVGSGRNWGAWGNLCNPVQSRRHGAAKPQANSQGTAYFSSHRPFPLTPALSLGERVPTLGRPKNLHGPRRFADITLQREACRSVCWRVTRAASGFENGTIVPKCSTEVPDLQGSAFANFSFLSHFVHSSSTANRRE